MQSFKDSGLYVKLMRDTTISQEALDFIDACTDDWECVDGYMLNGEQQYIIRSDLHGYYDGNEVNVSQINVCTLSGAVCLLEHLSFVNRLILSANGIGTG